MLKKIAALLTVLAFTGCALSGTDVARKSINTAESLRQIAASQLDALDATKQAAIIAEVEVTGDIPAAREKLEAWWKQRFSADVALAALKTALLVAEKVVSAVEAKTQGSAVLAPALAAVQQAVAGVLALFAQLGVKL